VNEVRFVQSFDRRAIPLTHVYARDQLLTFYTRTPFGGTTHRHEPRPRTICGQVIVKPRDLAYPIGTMCERCESLLDDGKVPSGPIEVAEWFG